MYKFDTKFLMNYMYGITKIKDYSVADMYPNSVLNFPIEFIEKNENFKIPLTKQQIFDLQFKWNLLPDSDIKVELKEWWDDPIYWKCICKYRELSEDFIREYRNRVNWVYISLCQKLSEEFIMEFIDRKLNAYALLINSNKDTYSEKLMTEINKRIVGELNKKEKLKIDTKLDKFIDGKMAKITIIDELA